MSTYSNQLQSLILSKLSKTCNYNVLFGSSSRDCHAQRIYCRTLRE